MRQSVSHTVSGTAISDADLPASPRHRAGSSPTASTACTAASALTQASPRNGTMMGTMPEDTAGSSPPATPSALAPRAEILPAETGAKTAKVHGVHSVHSGSEHAQQALSPGQHAAQAQQVQQQAWDKAGSCTHPHHQQQQQLSRWHTCTMPLLLPLLATWWALAHLLAWLCAFLVLPPYLLSRRLYWACPFIPAIFRAQGLVAGTLARLGFEGAYCINVVTRLLTLPLRRSLPSFYIIGFPKAGTTSLAAHLQAHPAISGIDGLPFHDALRKESHFLAGIFGRGPRSCSSPALYRSFFPTVMTRWWAEAVVGVDKWLCFDACPTYACMPYTAARAARLTPGAKIIVMLRDPADGLFSSETMIRNLGCDLAWSLAEPDQGKGDSRFTEDPSAEALWRQVCSLGPHEALPAQWPAHFYFSLAAKMQACRLDTCVGAWLDSFPREQVMAVDFKDFCRDPEEVVRRVLAFVGAQQELLAWAPQEAKMKTDYRGRRMHASVRRRLRAMFAASNRRLYALLGRDFGWEDPEEGGGGD